MGDINTDNPADTQDIRPLTDEEQGWIDQNWQIASEQGMTKDTDSLTLGYQAARGKWELAPADDRPRAEHSVVGLGALIGQYICNFTDFEWGVRGEGSSAQWVLTNPDGEIIEPMQRMAELWSGSMKKTVGGYVDEVLEKYSGER